MVVIERRKARAARASAAITACGELYTLLGEWCNAIDKAVKLEESADRTAAKLKEFQAQLHFEPRARAAVNELKKEPRCKELWESAGLFGHKALDRKGWLAMIQYPLPWSVSRALGATCKK
jgi:hypothetical protein